MIQSKTVDITPMKITLPVIEMSQYDLGREVIVHMKDGSDWFDLTGYTAKLQGTKPSGFGYTVDGVVDGHDITFASSYDMTSEAGFIPSEVRLTKDGVSLGSLNVMLHVEKTPHDVTVTDGSPETIISEMTELVERAEAAAEVLLDCSATATTLPAGSNATASYDVDNGVFTFGIPRGNRGETGDTGATGNGIASITKTGTSGLVDTYTITYTDGTTTTFTVTNGRNGTGAVADVTQNGVSVLDGTTAKVVVPTKTSDLTNDSGFVTSVPTKTSDLTNDSNFVSDGSYIHTDNNFTTAEKTKLSGIASGAEVNVQSDWNATSGDALILNKPTNVSAFTNDAGYITTETDPTVPSWAKASSKPTYTASEVGALPDTTVIPAPYDDSVIQARMDTFTQLAAGSTTGDAELMDGRVGADGVTYANIGGAIRGQVSDVKSDLEVEQDYGLYHRYLTWEHGGIDNATGANNNEGSLVRSRMPEYLLCADYEQVTNDSSSYAYVIYYNSDQSFKSSSALYNSASPVIIDKTATYFRLDLRADIDTTYHIRAYQKLRGSDIPHNIHENRYAQIYFQFNNGIVEEDVVNKKVYLNAPNSVSVRYGVNGSVVTHRTVTMSDLATEIGTSLVTSLKGVENCIAINDEYALAYDTTTKAFVLVHRYNLENKHIPIIVQNGGFVTYANSYIVKKMGGNSSESVAIPTYWSSAIADAETSINNYLASDEKSASFGFVTDTHIGVNSGYSGALLKKVMADCHIPVWFHGGDAVTGSGIISKSSLIGEVVSDFEQFKDIENIGLRAIGNHDPAFGVSNNYDSNLRNSEINHYYHGADREKYLQIYGEGKGYFYKDIHKDNLRCICLDIIPYESQVNGSDLVTGANKMHYHQFGSVQLDWFADVLSSTPQGYSVVVCSHIAPVSLAELQTLDASWSESVPTDYRQARKIAEAYAQKSVYSWSGSFSGDPTSDSYNINVDFSSAHGDFVCFFCGHTHKDFNLTLDNVLIVGTANDSIVVSTNAPSYAPSKTAGTATEQIIDFFCVLPTLRTMAVVRLGAYLSSNGKVRTFTY